MQPWPLFTLETLNLLLLKVKHGNVVITVLWKAELLLPLCTLFLTLVCLTSKHASGGGDPCFKLSDEWGGQFGFEDYYSGVVEGFILLGLLMKISYLLNNCSESFGAHPNPCRTFPQRSTSNGRAESSSVALHSSQSPSSICEVQPFLT